MNATHHGEAVLWFARAQCQGNRGAPYWVFRTNTPRLTSAKVTGAKDVRSAMTLRDEPAGDGGCGNRVAEYQISGMKNQSLTGHPGNFSFQRRTKIKLASQISQW
jgi:hypothetical protein